MITRADNGKTLCARPGTAVLVLLANAGQIQSTGPLTPRPKILPTLIHGETGAAFEASSPGTATITSVISPCGSGSGVHCMLLLFFHVTVKIEAA
jgi:hypothetical protein